MNVTLERVDNVAKNIKMFWFSSDQKLSHVAGQFIELHLPHANPDKRGIKRWFTLTSSPTEGKFAITTKFTAENGSSFKAALLALKPGDGLAMSQPMGDFVLPKDKSIPLVFVAGGIGVTPMRSMVKYLLDTNEKRTIQLIYAANSLEEVAFRDTFDQYGVKLTLVISNPPVGWTGETGQLTAERIQSIAGELNNKLIYISGPEPMVEAFYHGLKELGVDKKHLIADYFPNYPAS
jgi:ferredoxin-NADP reductase